MSRDGSVIDAFGVAFRNPILLAAGTAGFGHEVAGVMQLGQLGGLITKSVSPEPRPGHPSPRVAEFDGGMLNAVGLANPGVDRVATTDLPWLERHFPRLPVIVNVVGSVPEDYVAVIRRLEGVAGVTAFELNVSCPNTARGGEEFGATPEVLAGLVSLCRSSTSRPLIVKLAPTLPDIAGTAGAAIEAGADGLSLINTIPGTLYRSLVDNGPEAAAPRLGYGHGGVSGPGLLPIGVLATRRVRARTDLPIIGVGGVRRIEDVLQYRNAGATLVAVGTAALADPRLPERLAAEWGTNG